MFTSPMLAKFVLVVNESEPYWLFWSFWI